MNQFNFISDSSKRKIASSFMKIIIGSSFLLFSCKGSNTNAKSDTSIDETAADFNFETKLKHARKFIVNNYAEYKEVIILHPLQDDTLATYLLVPKATLLPDKIVKQKKTYLIHVPIKSIICLSSSHVGALAVLGLQDHIKGATNTDGYWDPTVQELVHEGLIKDVGRGMSTNIEQIIALQPDVITKNDHTTNISHEELLTIGINTLYYNDWRESDLLARAEWMKLMGLLFCKAELADSIFNKTEERYNRVKTLALTAQTKPRVLIAQDIRGVWFVPGDRSYVPRMIEDAHATIKTVEGASASLPCSFEQVFDEHRNDDYWFSLKGGTTKTLSEFGNSSEHYKKFEAFKNGQVYFNNKRVKPHGGNDFWESGAYYPDVILKDLVKIIHPELLPDHETYYWRKLD